MHKNLRKSPRKKDPNCNSPNWSKLPRLVLEIIFSFLELDDLRNCSLVCRAWYSILNDENNDVWRLHCVQKLAKEALRSNILDSVPSYRTKLKAFCHAWNPNDCSRNIYIKRDGFTLHRNPIARSTDGARGKIGFKRGRHCWEVWWQSPLGTVAVIGEIIYFLSFKTSILLIKISVIGSRPIPINWY